MLNAAVDDVRLADAAGNGVAAAVDLGDHAAGDMALLDMGRDLFQLEGRYELVVQEDALDVGEEYELLGLERFRYFSRCQVRIDVVGDPFLIDADGRDHRDEPVAVKG